MGNLPLLVSAMEQATSQTRENKSPCKHDCTREASTALFTKLGQALQEQLRGQVEQKPSTHFTILQTEGLGSFDKAISPKDTETVATTQVCH